MNYGISQFIFPVLFFQEASIFISTGRYKSEDRVEEPAKKLKRRSRGEILYAIILYEFQNKREAAASRITRAKCPETGDRIKETNGTYFRLANSQKLGT